MRISDWSSDVCSSDLRQPGQLRVPARGRRQPCPDRGPGQPAAAVVHRPGRRAAQRAGPGAGNRADRYRRPPAAVGRGYDPDAWGSGRPGVGGVAPTYGWRLLRRSRSGYNPAVPRWHQGSPTTPGVTGEYTPAANTRSGVSLARLEPLLQYVCRHGIWKRRQRGGPTPEPISSSTTRALEVCRTPLSGRPVPPPE